MGRSLLAGVLLVAACGRFDFDSQPPEGPSSDSHVLVCEAPTRFSIGTSLKTLNAVATAAGFAIVGVDNSGGLRGWTYEWTAADGTAALAPGAEAALAPVAQNVLLAADATTTMGIAAVGDELVVASIYGGANPAGTRLHFLGADLSPRAAAPSLAGMMAGEGPIARGGGDAAELALLSVDATNRVDARRIDTSGAELAPARIVVDSADGASSVQVATAKDGYVLSWTSSAGSPNKKRVARLDRNLDLVAGPVFAASGANEDAVRGGVAWLPEADRYLVAWFEKSATSGDDVWFQILDGALAPAMPATLLARRAVQPQIGTGGGRFFATWRDISTTPATLAAAVIGPDGAVTPRAVPRSSGAPLGYSVVERNGQAVLVWSETGGDGLDLWLDPMCP
jgi:hypothetical protein